MGNGKNAMAAMALCFFSVGAARAADFDHNGSRMDVDYERGAITYRSVKPSLRGFIKPGFVVFAGEIEKGGAVKGTAYIFRKNCEPAPYAVTGRYEASLPGYVLSGAAPIREKGACRVTGYSIEGGNTRLEFVDLSPNESGSASGTATSPNSYSPAPGR